MHDSYYRSGPLVNFVRPEEKSPDKIAEICTSGSYMRPIASVCICEEFQYMFLNEQSQ